MQVAEESKTLQHLQMYKSGRKEIGGDKLGQGTEWKVAGGSNRRASFDQRSGVAARPVAASLVVQSGMPQKVMKGVNTKSPAFGLQSAGTKLGEKEAPRSSMMVCERCTAVGTAATRASRDFGPRTNDNLRLRDEGKSAVCRNACCSRTEQRSTVAPVALVSSRQAITGSFPLSRRFSFYNGQRQVGFRARQKPAATCRGGGLTARLVSGCGTKKEQVAAKGYVCKDAACLRQQPLLLSPALRSSPAVPVPSCLQG